MADRADFYVGHGAGAEWIGSIFRYGAPDQLPLAVVEPESESAYRTAVADLIRTNDDTYPPERGWPWRWDTSATTDWAYAWDEERHALWASELGRPWWRLDTREDGGPAQLPDMSSKRATTPPRR